MLITTAMLAFLLFRVWRWNRWAAAGTIALFALVDTAFFLSNIAKIADGGWIPLLVAGMIFTVLTTWAKGRGVLSPHLQDRTSVVSGRRVHVSVDLGSRQTHKVNLKSIQYTQK